MLYGLVVPYGSVLELGSADAEAFGSTTAGDVLAPGVGVEVSLPLGTVGTVGVGEAPGVADDPRAFAEPACKEGFIDDCCVVMLAGRAAVACSSWVASSVRACACAGSTLFAAAIWAPTVEPSLTALSMVVTKVRTVAGCLPAETSAKQASW